MFLLCNSATVFAQNKSDFTWLLGSPSNHPELFYGGSFINFEQGNPTIEYFVPAIDLWYPDVISDEDGHLSFYNNGCKVINYNHELMEEGDDLNPGTLHEAYCDDPGNPIGYPSYQGHLTLPLPDHPGEYVMFHSWVNDDFSTRQVLYTQIDMNANDGEGKVIVKNHFLAQDYFSRAITATRHANGRDWWVVTARDTASLYYVFLLDPAGIHGPYLQQPDADWIDGHTIALSNIFSPDGSKYVRLGSSEPADFRIYDFDRCSGTLYNPVTVHMPDTTAYAPWACFSPNSRYLYVQTQGDVLFQLDLQAPDIGASAQVVGVYDGFRGAYNLRTRFNSMLIGPDQRIYISTRAGTNVLHTIYKPNEPGIACDFRQHDIILPAIYPFYLPNFPNYRLYNLQGSACDTLHVKPPMVAFWRDEPADSSLAVSFTDISYFQPTSWFWYFGDGATDTVASPMHTYAAPAIYEVCLVACNADGLCDTLCREIEVKLVSTVNHDLAVSLPVRLFPNPVEDVLIISSPLMIAEALEISIYDLQGKELLRHHTDESLGTEQLDIHLLPAGLYLIRLQVAGQEWSGKFVKRSP